MWPRAESGRKIIAVIAAFCVVVLVVSLWGQEWLLAVSAATTLAIALRALWGPRRTPTTQRH